MHKLTQHAQERMQQRGISDEVLECLMECGSKSHGHYGATIIFFDKSARRRLARNKGAGQYRRLESRLNAYAVLGEDGEIVTVGHRTKRINRQ